MDRLNIEDRFQIERLTLVLRHLQHAFGMSLPLAIPACYLRGQRILHLVNPRAGIGDVAFHLA